MLLRLPIHHLSERFSSIHAVAVSLGGQGALYSAYENHFNRTPNGRKLLKSVFVYSPVVDLKASVDGVFQDKQVADLGRALPAS